MNFCKSRKSVHFDNNIQEFITYSYKEYDRSSIDHVLRRRLSDIEMNNIFITLDLYKLFDMPVHSGSSQNTLYHLKKFFSSGGQV